MSAWKDDDEVTTTYGSIQLSLEQAHAAGVKTERERIIKLLENSQCKPSQRFHFAPCACKYIDFIKGENNE
jgi:hypothetical protein